MSNSSPSTKTEDRCRYCGDTFGTAVPLDIEIMDPDDDEWNGYYARYSMCSEECRDDARRDQAWLMDGQKQNYTRVHKSEVDYHE